MKETNKIFLIHTLVAAAYNSLFLLLIYANRPGIYTYSATLFLIAGAHAIGLIGLALYKMLRMKPVGNLGLILLGVIMTDIVFWLILFRLFF